MTVGWNCNQTDMLLHHRPLVHEGYFIFKVKYLSRQLSWLTQNYGKLDNNFKIVPSIADSSSPGTLIPLTPWIIIADTPWKRLWWKWDLGHMKGTKDPAKFQTYQTGFNVILCEYGRGEIWGVPPLRQLWRSKRWKLLIRRTSLPLRNKTMILFIQDPLWLVATKQGKKMKKSK